MPYVAHCDVPDPPQVYSCAVLRDPGSGLNRGYGFIKYMSKEIAQAAMAKLNDTEMKDHPGTKARLLAPAPMPAPFAAHRRPARGAASGCIRTVGMQQRARRHAAVRRRLWQWWVFIAP